MACTRQAAWRFIHRYFHRASAPAHGFALARQCWPGGAFVSMADIAAPVALPKPATRMHARCILDDHASGGTTKKPYTI